MKEVRAALKQALGFAPGNIDFGQRYDMDNPKVHDRIVDMREWPENSDLFDSIPLDRRILKEWAKRPNGIIVDLYVYRPYRENSWSSDYSGDLETNCTLVMAAGGELLTVYDSVGGKGHMYDNWWTERKML